MAKVTYLFGAGASRDALPIVDEIPNRLEECLKIYNDRQFELPAEPFKEMGGIGKSQYDLQRELAFHLNKALELANNHSSIDTAAKKLFVNQKWNELTDLKVAMTTFFVLEQKRNKVDKRYDSFYASILSDSVLSFAPNLRILSWNYDMQFELAYKEFTNRNSLDQCRQALGIVTKFEDRKQRRDRFSILKLNGSATIIRTNGLEQYYIWNDHQAMVTKELIESLVRSYALIKYFPNTYSSGLSFAWEVERTDRDIISCVEGDTDILVVVGYSFPFFNREVDRQLLNCLNPKKVYIQAPKPYADEIKESFKSVTSLHESLVHTITQVRQFFLPPEL